MPKTPDFERITATITDADIEAFYRSAEPEGFKRQVREAPDQETKKRFVAGYPIRTSQIRPERLNPTGAKKSKKTSTTAASATKVASNRRKPV